MNHPQLHPEHSQQPSSSSAANPARESDRAFSPGRTATLITRTGKIARLPQAIRQRLNERLADGEPQQLLVAWLNEHEIVRERLERFHGGRPITEQNLSDWKAGGFRDWERHQETRGMLRDFLSEAEELSAELGEEELLEKATNSVAFVLMRLFQEAMAAEPGPEQRQAVLQIARELTRMRQANHERQRVQLLVEEAHKASDQPPEPGCISWQEINQRNAEEDKAMKEHDDWLRTEAEALRAEYVTGMERRALAPERRQYIEEFFDRYDAELDGLFIKALPCYEEPKPRAKKKPARAKRQAGESASHSAGQAKSASATGKPAANSSASSAGTDPSTTAPE